MHILLFELKDRFSQLKLVFQTVSNVSCCMKWIYSRTRVKMVHIQPMFLIRTSFKNVQSCHCRMTFQATFFFLGSNSHMGIHKTISHMLNRYKLESDRRSIVGSAWIFLQLAYFPRTHHIKYFLHYSISAFQSHENGYCHMPHLAFEEIDMWKDASPLHVCRELQNPVPPLISGLHIGFKSSRLLAW